MHQKKKKNMSLAPNSKKLKEKTLFAFIWNECTKTECLIRNGQEWGFRSFDNSEFTFINDRFQNKSNEIIGLFLQTLFNNLELEIVMAENENKNQGLEQDTYQILKNRLAKQSNDLIDRLGKLNEERKATFGSVDTQLLANERITTNNNCLARDLIPLGNRFIFGYNVHMGLKKETLINDVFSVYTFSNQTFHQEKTSFLEDEQFVEDFQNLYKYYKHTQFATFGILGPHLYMAFHMGKTAGDIKAFNRRISSNGLTYVDNRSEHESK